jgi:hypothetical protein
MQGSLKNDTSLAGKQSKTLRVLKARHTRRTRQSLILRRGFSREMQGRSIGKSSAPNLEFFSVEPATLREIPGRHTGLGRRSSAGEKLPAAFHARRVCLKNRIINQGGVTHETAGQEATTVRKK